MWAWCASCPGNRKYRAVQADAGSPRQAILRRKFPYNCGSTLYLTSSPFPSSVQSSNPHRVSYPDPVSHTHPVSYSDPVDCSHTHPVSYPDPVSHTHPVSYSDPVDCSHTHPVSYSDPVECSPPSQSRDHTLEGEEEEEEAFETGEDFAEAEIPSPPPPQSRLVEYPISRSLEPAFAQHSTPPPSGRPPPRPDRVSPQRHSPASGNGDGSESPGSSPGEAEEREEFGQGGLAWDAADDERPECDVGHCLELMLIGVGPGCTGYATHRCDRCSTRGLRHEVWRCEACDFDLCPCCAASDRRLPGPHPHRAGVMESSVDRSESEGGSGFGEPHLMQRQVVFDCWAAAAQRSICSPSGLSAAESAAAAANVAAAAYDSSPLGRQRLGAWSPPLGPSAPPRRGCTPELLAAYDEL
eukprot:Hpha_TRINITY_DN16450_c2_g4::TRINITY_DN16450_c2_g4_i2::g.163914::m.163914